MAQQQLQKQVSLVIRQDHDEKACTTGSFAHWATTTTRSAIPNHEKFGSITANYTIENVSESNKGFLDYTTAEKESLSTYAIKAICYLTGKTESQLGTITKDGELGSMNEQNFMVPPAAPSARNNIRNHRHNRDTHPHCRLAPTHLSPTDLRHTAIYLHPTITTSLLSDAIYFVDTKITATSHTTDSKANILNSSATKTTPMAIYVSLKVINMNHEASGFPSNYMPTNNNMVTVSICDEQGDWTPHINVTGSFKPASTYFDRKRNPNLVATMLGAVKVTHPLVPTQRTTNSTLTNSQYCTDTYHPPPKLDVTKNKELIAKAFSVSSTDTVSLSKIQGTDFYSIWHNDSCKFHSADKEATKKYRKEIREAANATRMTLEMTDELVFVDDKMDIPQEDKHQATPKEMASIAYIVTTPQNGFAFKAYSKTNNDETTSNIKRRFQGPYIYSVYHGNDCIIYCNALDNEGQIQEWKKHFAAALEYTKSIPDVAVKKIDAKTINGMVRTPNCMPPLSLNSTNRPTTVTTHFGKLDSNDNAMTTHFCKFDSDDKDGTTHFCKPASTTSPTHTTNPTCESTYIIPPAHYHPPPTSYPSPPPTPPTTLAPPASIMTSPTTTHATTATPPHTPPTTNQMYPPHTENRTRRGEAERNRAQRLHAEDRRRGSPGRGKQRDAWVDGLHGGSQRGCEEGAHDGDGDHGDRACEGDGENGRRSERNVVNGVRREMELRKSTTSREYYYHHYDTEETATNKHKLNKETTTTQRTHSSKTRNTTKRTRTRQNP